MEVRKDYILRAIQQGISLIEKMLKKGNPEEDTIITIINNSLNEDLQIDISFFIETDSKEIISYLSKKEIDTELYKIIADLMMIRIALEKETTIKKNLAQKTMDLYLHFEKKSALFSFELQSKISELSSI